MKLNKYYIRQFQCMVWKSTRYVSLFRWKDKTRFVE